MPRRLQKKWSNAWYTACTYKKISLQSEGTAADTSIDSRNGRDRTHLLFLSVWIASSWSLPAEPMTMPNTSKPSVRRPYQTPPPMVRLEPTQMSSVWQFSPTLPTVVSETEMANKAEDSVEENTSEESSIETATEVSSTSFTSSNPIYNPMVFSTELQTIATIQQRVALFTR